MNTFSALRLLMLLTLAAACTIGCDRDPPKTESAAMQRREVLVLAASSLKDAFTELGTQLEAADSTVTITFSFGASNLLARQITAGAPADVYASAAEEVMDSLQGQGELVPDTRRTFAGNRLVVISQSGADTLAMLDAITAPKYTRIAIAAPGVPARIYAEEALRKAGLWDRLQPRMVFGENVRQVVDYVAGGEAQLGVVYSTDAQQFSTKVAVVARIDQSLHRRISYPAAILKNATNAAGAKVFIDFLAGARGQEILRKYGFVVGGGV